MRILLASHGLMGEGILDSLKMLVGEVNKLDVITFTNKMGVDDLKEELGKYLASNTDDLLVFTDLKGGTPFNVASILTQNQKGIKIFYGMNLPLIIEAVMMKETMDFVEVIEHIESNISGSIGFSDL